MTTKKDTDVFGGDALQQPQQAPQKAVEAVVEASLSDAIPIVKEAFKAAVEDVGTGVAGILAKEPAEVVLDEVVDYPAVDPSSKPLFQYTYLLSCIVGQAGEVVTVDHLDDALNGSVSVTTEILSYNRDTGGFETTEAVYKPVKK